MRSGGSGSAAWLRAPLAPLLVALALFAQSVAQAGVPVYKTYRFQRNRDRAVRKETRFIILHTTEGPTKGSGEKLKRYGEAHYMIDPQGHVYDIVDIRRVAYHCGLSMWNGRTGLDNCSIGIEMVGYHDKDLTAEQIKSLRELIAQLRKRYPGVTDDRVLTHSMIAYGTPNHWYKRNHRGRKRCGMKMADDLLRLKLGIRTKPYSDPDVKAHRLIVADKELAAILYARRTTASKPQEPKASTTPTAQLKNRPATKKTPPPTTKQQNDQTTKPPNSPTTQPPNQPNNQTTQPSPQKNTKPDTIGPGRSAWDIAKAAYNAPTTLYVFPDGTMKTGADITDWKSMKAGTKVIVGANDGGAAPAAAIPAPISSLADEAASTLLKRLAGEGWNATNTFYVVPTGQYFAGSDLNSTNLALLNEGSRILSGYRVAGRLESGTALWNICRGAWNRTDTCYLLPSGSLIQGDKIDPSRIPLGTTVFVKEER